MDDEDEEDEEEEEQYQQQEYQQREEVQDQKTIDVNSNVQQTIRQFEELLDATQDPEQKSIL